MLLMGLVIFFASLVAVGCGYIILKNRGKLCCRGGAKKDPQTSPKTLRIN